MQCGNQAGEKAYSEGGRCRPPVGALPAISKRPGTTYLYFGRIPAKLDDAANYLPSRLAGLLWCAAAALTGNSAKGAWRIWWRDRRNHASPNSAQTESACAGALGVQLAGPAYYFGEYYPKPTIGDALHPIEPEDIRRANKMMYAESLLALLLGLAIRGVIL